MRERGRLDWWLGVILAGRCLFVPDAFAAEIVIYGFEGTLRGWAIPDWAKSSTDYGGASLSISDAVAAEGHSALEIRAILSGERWSGAYVEREVEVTDWTPFGRLSVDVYLPPQAPEGLAGKIILTLGDQWQWTEMNRSIPLVPGEWMRIAVSLKPGSMDWKTFPDDEFRKNVRKIGVRIESNKTAYTGSMFLDNMLLGE